MPPTIAARWMTWLQPVIAVRASLMVRRSPRWISQPSRIQSRRLALVGDPDLEGRVAQQAAHDGLTDRAGAAGDENAVHGRGAG